MAESSSSKSSGAVPKGGQGHPKYSRGKYNRSSSEHRNKTSSKADLHRSLSSQSLPQENPKKDAVQVPGQSFVPDDVFKEIFEAVSSFPDFFTRVNCPFCLEVLKDKIELVRHLNDNCRKRKPNYSKLFSIFQILPNNSFKCNICPGESLPSLDEYFVHVNSPGHNSACSEAVEKWGQHLSDFLYCSCCYVHVPDNLTQLQAHLRNRIHKLRGIEMSPADFKAKGILCIFCFFHKKKTFRCLGCPSSKSVFSTPLEMIQHLKGGKHLIKMKYSVSNKVYCGLCKLECNVTDIPFHFMSGEHLLNEATAQVGEFELCFYCGFSCEKLADLSAHMRLSCYEIEKIRKRNKTRERTEESETGMIDKGKTGGKDTEERTRLGCDEIRDIRKENKPKDETKESEKKKGNERDMKEKEKTRRKDTERKKAYNEECCILVKDDDVEVLGLLKVFKTFGQIHSLTKYNQEYFLFEFKNESSVQDICVLRKLLRIGNKPVHIKLLGEVEEEEEEEEGDGKIPNYESDDY